jgi:electron transfer flavoprotein alpha subunit
VLVASTSIGWDIAPALAAQLNAPLVVGGKAVQADGAALKVTAGFCGGKMLADVAIADAPAILMMLPGSYRPAGETGRAQVETRSSPVPLQPSAITFDELILPQGGDVDITQQDILVAVGRGIKQKDDLEVAQELAEALGGELAASRPIVDQGWLPPTRQVGKSGMTVKPRCYLALGVSGAPEHLEGMKDSELIIAVNTDPNAPIFEAAHYGAVADLLDLAPALTDVLKQR